MKPADSRPLRRLWNPPNRFDANRIELEEEERPAVDLEVYEDASRSVLSHNDSPDIGFRWSVNPYRGCFHACAYCYARPSHEFLGLGAGTDFERKIFVKPDAAQLLDRAFRKKSWERELVVFSGVTDCYQPLEAAWGLTRGCLEVCERHANPLAIVTKSALVRRDKDILARIAARAPVSVSISIPFLSGATARRIEPSAPAPARRFAAMRELADAGIRVGISVAPIIPGLNDRDVPRLLMMAKENGATFAFRTLLRLPGSVRAVFLRRLAEEFPDRAAAVIGRIRDVRGGKLSESRFGQRHHGKGAYWDTIEAMWRVSIRRAGLHDRDEERERVVVSAPLPPSKEAPASSPQMDLPW